MSNFYFLASRGCKNCMLIKNKLPQPIIGSNIQDHVLGHLQQIQEARIYIACTNHRPFSELEAISLLFAIHQNKPIVLTESINHEVGIKYFVTEIVNNRLSKFMLCNIALLDSADLCDFIESIAQSTTNYGLNRHETILIKSHLQAYFRNHEAIESVELA